MAFFYQGDVITRVKNAAIKIINVIAASIRDRGMNACNALHLRYIVDNSNFNRLKRVDTRR